MVMYSIYNSDTLEKLINTVNKMHNKTTWNEKNSLPVKLIICVIGHYAINSFLYLTMTREKYVKMFERLISQLWMYAKAKRDLLKGSLPISLLLPSKLQEILGKVKKAIQIANPDYDIVIKRLHLCHDMTLVTFGIDKERNQIVQFPVFVQPYTQQQLILYQIETVPVPIIDQNKQVHSYTHSQIDRWYIALNSEAYILLRQQELRTGKKIGYTFYCEELFVVKHKSWYSCESAIDFTLSSDVIKENYNFAYHFNKTDIKPNVLDGRNEIIWANWPGEKHIVYDVNNDIPVKIPSFTYALVTRSVLCNCWIEAENNFLLEC